MSAKHPFDNAVTCDYYKEGTESGGKTYTTEVVAEEGGWKGQDKSNTWLEEGRDKLKNIKNMHNHELLEIQDSRTYCTEVYNILCNAVKSISSGFIVEKARYWLTLAGVSGDAYLDIDFVQNRIRFYKSWLSLEDVKYKAFTWYTFTEDVLREYLIIVLGAK